MRVLYIASGDDKYGAPKSMMSLVLYMKEYYDVEPVVLTKRYNKINTFCDDNKIENYTFWYSDFMSGAPYSFKLLRLIKHVVKYVLYIGGMFWQHNVFACGIDFNTIDIIHTNHSRIYIGAYISRKKKIPHVWHIREFGKEDYNVIFYRPNTISYMNNHADQFIAISDAVRKCWIKKGIETQKIVTIYNGIEKNKFIRKVNRQDDKLKLVITGHIQPNKGQLQIVKAIAFLPPEIRQNVQLDIIGEGYKDYIRKINKYIKRHSLSNVFLRGYCDNVPKKLSEYDVGVVCSKAEAFGRVTVEYMRAGLYVIASDQGANKELVSKNNMGTLYKYGNIQSLSECIINVCFNRKKYLISQSNLQAFGMEEYVGKIYKIYMELKRKL